MAAKGIVMQLVDTNGNPYSGAKLNVYDAGSTTRRNIYTDSGLTILSANPAVADASGYAHVWVDDSAGNIKVVATNSAASVTAHSQDAIPIANLTYYPVLSFTGDQTLNTTSTPTFAGITLGVVSFAGVTADPGADRLMFWDDSASQVAWASLGTGLSFDGTTFELDADLEAISGLTPADGAVIIGNGTSFVTESGATLRASIGVGTASNPTDGDNDWTGANSFRAGASFTLKDPTDTTKQVRIDASGVTTGTTRTKTLQDVSGTLYETGGVDVSVADGGTGASAVPAARVNLGFTDVELPDGTQTGVASGSFSLSAGGVVQGFGQRATVLERDANGGNLRAVSSTDFVELRDFTLDNNYSVNADSGHALSLTDCDYYTIENLRATDFGNNGGSAGTGILAAATTGQISHGIIDKVRVDGDTATSTDTNGVLVVDGLYTVISKAVVENVVSFAIEYKNNTQYSLMSDLIAHNAAGGIVFGQDTAGVDGVDYCAVSNGVARACDQGITLGEATHNVIGNVVVDATGAPGTDIYGAHVSTDSNNNVIHHVLTAGANVDFSTYIRGARNHVSLAAHDSAASVVTFNASARSNFVEILHPGTRTSIFGSISDSSGVDPDSSTGNVVHSPATGEYQGSLSGKYHWKLNPITSPGALLSSQNFVFENDGDMLLTVRQSATAGQVGGFSINTPSGSNYAGMQYNHQGGGANDYWQMLVGGSVPYRWFSTTFRPVTDNATALGTTAARWNNIYGYTVDAKTAVAIDGTVAINGVGSAIANITSSATSGTLPTADGSITIADATAPTNAELLEYCVELEAKIEAVLATMRDKKPSIAT